MSEPTLQYRDVNVIFVSERSYNTHISWIPGNVITFFTVRKVWRGRGELGSVAIFCYTKSFDCFAAYNFIALITTRNSSKSIYVQCFSKFIFVWVKYFKTTAIKLDGLISDRLKCTFSLSSETLMCCCMQLFIILLCFRGRNICCMFISMTF